MKILILISEIKYSGAAKIATWLANNLADKGYDISLLTIMDGDDCQEIQKNVNRIRICSHISSRVKRTLTAISNIHRLIVKNKYDMVVSFLPLEGFIAVVSSFFTKTSVIVSERSDPFHEKTPVAAVARFFFRFADGAVFQSKGAQKYYPRGLRERSAIIENPVIKNIYTYIPYKDRNDEIVSSSRLSLEQKRQDVLIKAFAKVSSEYSSIKLRLIGDGPDKARLEELVRELGIEDKVIFVGKSGNVISEIRTAKIFAFSSDFEGMPNSVLEALSVGIPVVTTDYSPGGARELVESQGRGYVVPCGDADQLADKMLQILSDAEKASNMSIRALTVFDDHSESKIIDQWISYIESVYQRSK